LGLAVSHHATLQGSYFLLAKILLVTKPEPYFSYLKFVNIIKYDIWSSEHDYFKALIAQLLVEQQHIIRNQEADAALFFFSFLSVICC